MTEVLTYEALKADRDAQQKRADALAVENAEMRSVIDAAVEVYDNSAGIAGWHLNGDIAGWDEILPELNIETPATSAALAAIEARGVEKFADVLGAMCQQEKANSVRARVLKHVVFLAVHHAKELREAK
uniref:hypothetical protein n=1 Tax=Serratia quinivorans TaxID=137545 RepID=UPI0035C6CC33